MSKRLEELQAYLGETAILNRAGELLYWDISTTMPPLGFEGHQEAMTYFSTRAFQRETSEELKSMLSDLLCKKEYEALDDTWKFIVSYMNRDLERKSRVPADFFEEYCNEQAASEFAWREAKQKNDFSIFAPHLEKMIEMTRQNALYMEPEKDPYDTLLDQFEEGMDQATYDRLFGELKKELLPLVDEVTMRDVAVNPLVYATCDTYAQAKVQKILLEYIGFDFEKGAVGETEHPFTMGFSSQDVRVTNHFKENNALDGMFSAIHEGGHAIFDQNVNALFDGTVAHSCENMGIHESQSRFYENILGRNKNFWLPIYGQIQDLLPAYRDLPLDDFMSEVNHVKRSLIRTEADEVTYCLHIIIRYELEKEIFSGHVAVSDLPELWNQKMKDYLGIVPDSDADGILQDMHWSDGSFGYFPSYLLGSIYDGMYIDAMEEELGSIDELLATGQIQKITSWLNEKIHVYGNTRSPKQVIDAICGKEVSAEPLCRYFKKKYLGQ